LFLGAEKEDTILTQTTIYKWVNESLRELQKLGWIQILKMIANSLSYYLHLKESL